MEAKLCCGQCYNGERPEQVQESVQKSENLYTEPRTALCFSLASLRGSCFIQSLMPALLYCLDPKCLPMAHMFKNAFMLTMTLFRHYRHFEDGTRLGE